MPVKVWGNCDFRNARFEDSNAFLTQDWIGLRKTDSSGDFDPSGTYKAATLLLPAFRGTGVTRWNGFELNYYYAYNTSGTQTTTIDVQLSNDDGTTFYYWDGAAWAVATTQWSTPAEISENISTLPFTTEDRSLIVRLRLNPSSDGECRPLLREALVSFEVEIDGFEDAKRSIKRKLDNGLGIQLTYRGTLASASDQIQLETNLSSVTSVRGVYNITSDPGKTTDLFSSIDASNVVTMTAAQSASSVIEIQYSGACPVFLSADAWYEPTELPSIWVEMTPVTEMPEIKYGTTSEEINGTGVRRRLHQTYHRHRFRLHCLSGYELESLKISNAVCRLFQGATTFFVSLAAGFDYTVLSIDPHTEADRVRDNLYDKIVEMEVFGVQYDTQLAYEDTEKLLEIGIGIGTSAGRDQFIVVDQDS